MRDALKRFYRKNVPDSLAGPVNTLYKRFRNPNPRIPVHESQVIDELESIFVHVPRTGGTSVEKVLEKHTAKNPLFGHTTALEYQMMFPEKWKRYHSFGFARNPWDRLASSFFYLQRSLRNSFFVKNFVVPHGDDLSSFVTTVMRDYPSSIFMIEHLRPQFHYLCNTDHTIAVDFLGRFETINKDWQQVAAKLGLNEALPHTNHSKRNHYSKHYSSEAAEIVARAYKDDIEIFGYRYGDEDAVTD